jgi:hypothetical protein
MHVTGVIGSSLTDTLGPKVTVSDKDPMLSNAVYHYYDHRSTVTDDTAVIAIAAEVAMCRRCCQHCLQ